MHTEGTKKGSRVMHVPGGVGGVANSTVFSASGYASPLSAGISTWYLALTGSHTSNLVEWQTQQVIRRAGTIRNLHVRLTTAPGVGNSRVFTLRVNGVNTGLTCTIAGGAAVQCSDLVNAVAVNPGDLVNWCCTVLVGAASSYVTISCEFFAGAVDFATLMNCNEDDNPLINVDVWTGLMHHYDWWTVLPRTQQVMPRAGTLRNMRIRIRTAPGLGNSWTFTLVVNGVNTALTCTITGLAVECEDIVNAVAVNAGDLVNVLIRSSAVAVNLDHFSMTMEFY